MIRWFLMPFIAVLMLVGCTKQDHSSDDEEEWAEIQALADRSVPERAVEVASGGQVVPQIGRDVVSDTEFEPFIRRLEEMKTAERKEGETLLTGETLVFDYDRKFVKLDQNVVVEDDQATLRAASLTGRFSVSNEVQSVVASGGVELISGTRTASADYAAYNHLDGFIELRGQASASEGGNRLSGERIQVWIRDGRKMVCEPNALLEISEASGLPVGQADAGRAGRTEIRANRVVYNEAERLAELQGNVRVRDPRAAMNCGQIRLYLKDDNEIDWIEAFDEVIIQSEDRKALAERATYHADEGKFTLMGEPKVKQGMNVMTGDRILFWHEPPRMVCEPNARVLLYLDEETKAKFLKDLDE